MEPGNERTWPRQEWRRARIKGSDDGGAKKGGGESGCADLESEEPARGWTRANGSIRSTNVAKYIPRANRL